MRQKKYKLNNHSKVFQSFIKHGEHLPVPGVYGTDLWGVATLKALDVLGFKLEREQENFSITLPKAKRSTLLTKAQLWEYACMASCLYRSEDLSEKDQIQMWESGKPWVALQAHELKHCRDSLTPEQIDLFNNIASAATKYAIPIPNLTILKHGWAWMFEKSPGVWPPAELVNPRTCLFDPVLGLLSFRDIYEYLDDEDYPAAIIWAHELAFSIAAYFAYNNSHMVYKYGSTLAKSIPNEYIHALIQGISAPYKIYNGDLSIIFQNLETSYEDPQIAYGLAILTLGWYIIVKSGIPSPISLPEECEMECITHLKLLVG